MTFRATRAAVTVILLLVFAGIVAMVTLGVRRDLHDQVLAREAESLDAVVKLQLRLTEDEWSALGTPPPPEDRFVALLQTTRLRGVIALRLYEPGGGLREALPPVADASLSLAQWERVKRREAFARLRANASLPEIVGENAGGAESKPAEATVLEVLVPVEEPGGRALAGAAQFLMDGASVAIEMKRVDSGLLRQAALAIAGGGALIGGLLAWAFHRLGEANRRLREQSEDLARANRELTFAAKTSAIGAISAHLIHGLKNPLAGLEGFVSAGPGVTPGNGDGGDAWVAAADTTRRLRNLINEVVTVLRDESVGLSIRLSLSEVAQSAQAGVAALAAREEITVSVSVDGEGSVSGRAANLAGLVLRNLLSNAIEASRSGSCVRLQARSKAGGAEFCVTDEGSGLPEAVRSALFQPAISGKPGGGGIGLALSHHLARHAQGTLELVETGPRGTTFRLTVPAL